MTGPSRIGNTSNCELDERMQEKDFMNGSRPDDEQDLSGRSAPVYTYIHRAMYKAPIATVTGAPDEHLRLKWYLLEIISTCTKLDMLAEPRNMCLRFDTQQLTCKAE